jgi:hypothetical protein
LLTVLGLKLRSVAISEFVLPHLPGQFDESVIDPLEPAVDSAWILGRSQRPFDQPGQRDELMANPIVQVAPKSATRLTAFRHQPQTRLLQVGRQ